MTKKKTKLKSNNKLLTGLAAGAAAGLLTFFFVKPKLSNKSKEAVSDNLKVEEDSTTNSGDLFI